MTRNRRLVMTVLLSGALLSLYQVQQTVWADCKGCGGPTPEDICPPPTGIPGGGGGGGGGNSTPLGPAPAGGPGGPTAPASSGGLGGGVIFPGGWPGGGGVSPMLYQAPDSSGWPIFGDDGLGTIGGGSVTDPIVVNTGEYVLSPTDTKWPHHGSFFSLDRLYRHQTANRGGITSDFGRHFNTNLRIFVTEDGAQRPADVHVHLGNGVDIVFDDSGTAYTAPEGWERYELEKVNGTQFVLTDKNGYTYTFEDDENPANLESCESRYGVGQAYSYDVSGYCSAVTRYSDSGQTQMAEITIVRDVDHTITQIYDSEDTTIDYTYDANCNLIKVEDACGTCSTLPTVEYEYDASNRMIVIKDATETTIRTIVYDASNRVSYYDDANAGRYAFSYNSPAVIEDPNGNSTEYTYDQDGHLTSKKFKMGAGDADDILYQYAYDDSGRVSLMTAPNGAVVAQSYDSRGNLLSKTVTADSETLTLFAATYESTYNQPLTAVDAKGVSTTYVYNANGSLSRETQANGVSIDYLYTDHGQVSSRTLDSVETKYTYNSSGFVEKETVDFGGLALETELTLDSMNRNLSKESPLGNLVSKTRDNGGKLLSETTAAGIVTEYDYDDNGRQVQRKIMDGESVLHQWTTTYDDEGYAISRTAPDGEITTYAYDANGNSISSVAPNGRKRESVYDELNRVIESKEGDTAGTDTVLLTTYDKMGNVLSTEDAEGRVTEHEYDGFGRRETTTDCTGAYTVYEYDGVLQTAVKRYDSDDQIVTHSKTEYDVMGRVTKTRQLANPGGSEGNDDAVTETQYGDSGEVVKRIVWVDTTTANTTTYAYDTAGRQTKVTDPDDKETEYAYDADGRRTKVTNANGHDTIYAYDNDGRQTRVTNANGDYTETDYDDRGLQTEVSQYASGDTLMSRTRYGYDAGGRQTLVRRMANPTTENDNNDHVVRSYYDEGGVLTKKRSASGHDTTYAYDSHGWQTLVTLPDGSYTTSQYDDSGKLTGQIRYEIVGANTLSYEQGYTLDCLGRAITTTNQGPDGTFGNADDLETEKEYDAVGRIINTFDEANRIVKTDYDALGRKTKVTEDSATIARVTEFDYDRAGRLVMLTAYTDSPSTGQQDTQYAYNGRGLQTIVTYSATGHVTMAYDDVGNMTQRTDEEGVVVDYAYDATNRLTLRQKNGATVDIEKYAYDALGRLITGEKGSSGNPDSVSKSIFSYDNLSRVTEESQAIKEGTAVAIEYTYDKAGNRITLQQDAADTTVAYAYDRRDRCVDIDQYDDADSEWVQLAEYTWLGNAVSKRETTCDFPGNTKPKFKTDFPRDGLMRVTSVENKHLTEGMADSAICNLGSWDYTYDTSSNVLSAVSTASLAGKLRDQRLYTYDTLNRLITAQVKDVQDWTGYLPNADKTTWYQYDDLGNRISHDYREDGAIAYAHDKANRMTTLAGLTQGYDDAGNLTLAYSADRGTSYVYKYDHHNRLAGIYDGATGTTQKAAFTYDALGRRIEHVNDVTNKTVRYYYDGVNEVFEAGSAGGKLRTYVHGISYVDERLMMMNYAGIRSEGDERPYYFTIDRMYNVRGLVDRAGSLIERYVYDPYGRPLLRECAGRGDLWGPDSKLDTYDDTLVGDVIAGNRWDARADLDDDGDFDNDDQTAFDAKQLLWFPESSPTVAEAFSDVGNPFMHQGRPHFAIDTESDATEATLMLNDHRARFNAPVIGRWITRDPLGYNALPSNKLDLLQILGQPTPDFDLHLGDNVIDGVNWWMVVAKAEQMASDQVRSDDGQVAPRGLRAGGVFYLFLESMPTIYRDPTGLSVDCGPMMCACSSGSHPVSVYGESARARLIGRIAGWKYGGCVTLLVPPGIFCTGGCQSLKTATAGGAGNVKLLDHECCHWCDWKDNGLCKYLDGAINDDCNSRAKTGTVSW